MSSDLFFDLISIVAFNLRSIYANSDYIAYLISSLPSPSIFCFSEHWLHSYDLSCLRRLFPSFHSSIEVVKDHPYAFEPRLSRGSGGVAIMWHESLSSRISPVPVPRGERLVGIRLSSRPPVLLFSCYLPTRSGCTDLFKSVLDELDSCFTLYVGEILLFAGDFNADPGLHCRFLLSPGQ